MTDLFIKVKIQQEQQLPYVLFCKPDSDKIVGVFQKNDHIYFLETFEEKGFVFTSFEAETFPYIPLEHSDIYVENVVTKDYFFAPAACPDRDRPSSSRSRPSCGTRRSR